MIVNRPVIIQSNVDFAKKSDVQGSTSIPAAVNFIRTNGHVTTGDTGAALYKRSSSEPSHEGKIQDAGNVWWEIAEPVIRPQMFGAVGDGVTDDRTAFVNALALGKPVFVPKSSTPYMISSAIALPANAVIYGEKGTEIKSSTVDAGIFGGTSVAGIRISRMKLTGCAGSAKAGRHAAINLDRCTDFHISDIDCEGWPDRGVMVEGDADTATYARRGVIEQVRWHDAQLPCRFSGAAVFIGEHTKDITVRDCDIDGADGGIYVQNSQTTVAFDVSGHKILNNRVRNAAQYGIILYMSGASVTITGAADNGSGLIRITAAAHGLSSGDQVLIASVTGTTEANGLHVVTVISSSTFDLRGSVFTNAYVSGGTVIRYNPIDTIVEGNTIEDVSGEPTVVNGMSGTFGAGIYCVGVGGFIVRGNVIRRSNTGTTTSSLAPAGIGINGLSGHAVIEGNLIEDCDWHGVYVVSSFSGSQATIANNTINRAKRVGVRGNESGGLTIANNVIRGRVGETTAQAIEVTASSAVSNVVITGNRARVYGPNRPLTVTLVSKLVCTGNHITNDAPAATTCELTYFNTVATGTITGNVFDGGLSGWAAFNLDDCTNTLIAGNYISMTDSGSARPCAKMLDTCTGSVFEASNILTVSRHENTSTGGKMHTRSTAATSGGKTRQVGDTIQNTAPSAGNPWMWIRIVAGTGVTSSDIKSVDLAA
jgi:hypothetical protein